MLLRFPNGLRHIAMAVLVVLLSSCFSTATIQRRSGPPIAGRIERSDSEKLYLSSANGEQFTVDRSDIVDIDHPGNVNLTIGIVAAVLGTLMLVGATTHVFCRQSSPCVSKEASLLLYVYGMGFAYASLPLMGVGLWTYTRSIEAATPWPPAPGGQARIDDLPHLTCSFCPQRL